MFCQNCGKELPKGSKFCNFCGTKMPEEEPRHARQESEEIFSHSDVNEHSEFDVTPLGVDQQDTREIAERTRVYDFGLFEEPSPPEEKRIDDREIINDSFDEYTEEGGYPEDDPELDDGEKKKKKLIWLWIVLGVIGAVAVVAAGFFIARAFSQNGKNNQKPTVAPTVATQPATQKPTQPVTERPTDPPTEKPTERPTEKPTEPPVTEPPVTEAPETEPPATEPPAPTEPETVPETSAEYDY